MPVAWALDPFNIVFDLFFVWVMYASGYGRLMWAAIKDNHYGFTWHVKPMGMVTEEDRLK